MDEVKEKQFTQLKIHTQYSICEGALKTGDLAKYCKENRIKAVREVVGENVEILIEGHAKFNVMTAVKISEKYFIIILSYNYYPYCNGKNIK